MPFKKKTKHKRQKLMTTVKSALPMLGLVISTGCEMFEPEPHVYSNPKSSAYDMNMEDLSVLPGYDGNPEGSLYDFSLEMGDSTTAGEATAGEATAGEATAGEATAGTE